MINLQNSSNVNYGAPVSNAIYKALRSINITTPVNSVDDKVAQIIIKNPFRSEVSGIIQILSDAVTVLFLTETLGQALVNLEQKCVRIAEIAQKAAGGAYSAEDTKQKQEQLKSLCGEINDIIENTEYNGNKLFGADGQDISISIGDGSVIELVAEDFSVDVENMDLSANPHGGLEKLKEEIKAIREYDGFLLGVRNQVETVTTLMQFELGDICEVETRIPELNKSLELETFSLGQITEDAYKAMRCQANVEHFRALQLLKETMPQLIDNSEEDTE